MTIVSKTFRAFVAPFAAVLQSAKEKMCKDPVPCWTEYLREGNKPRN